MWLLTQKQEFEVKKTGSLHWSPSRPRATVGGWGLTVVTSHSYSGPHLGIFFLFLCSV